MGVLQIIPSTAAFIMKDREYRLRRSKNYLLYRPSDNIRIGSKYMKFLFDLPIVNNDLMWMLASYNAGPGNFKKWTEDKKYKNSDSLLMLESLPASETRNYIKLVLTNLWIYKARFNEKNSILSVLASGKPINSKIFFKSYNCLRKFSSFVLVQSHFFSINLISFNISFYHLIFWNAPNNGLIFS